MIGLKLANAEVEGRFSRLFVSHVVADGVPGGTAAIDRRHAITEGRGTHQLWRSGGVAGRVEDDAVEVPSMRRRLASLPRAAAPPSLSRPTTRFEAALPSRYSLRRCRRGRGVVNLSSVAFA
jgi:hypothetical protein